MPFDILVACTREGGIGKDGKIPWYLPPDLRYFQHITSETTAVSNINAVIMGRNTWDSLPKRPLKGRRNIVLTSMTDTSSITAEGGEVFRTLDDALTHLENDRCVEHIFVIGGGRLYEEAINHPRCSKIYTTIIDKDYVCDTFFPIERLEKQNNSGIEWNNFSLAFFTIGMRYKVLYKDIPFEYRRYDRNY